MLTAVDCVSLAELESIRNEWNDLLGRSPNASVFTSWEWVEACWRFTRPGKTPLVILVRDSSGRLVGLAPLASTRRLRVLRQIEVLGCEARGYPLGDYGGPVSEPGMERAVWDAILQRLTATRWQLVDLRNCMGSEQTQAAVHGDAARNHGWHVQTQSADACRRVPLPTSFDSYLAAVGPSTRQSLRRKMRKLRDGGVTIERVDALDTQARNDALETLFDLHQARWGDDPSGGAFPDQRVRSMHRFLAGRLADIGALDLRVARSTEGLMVGVIYNLQFNGVTYYYQMGLSETPEWRRFGIGVCLLTASIEGAIADGSHTFDLLRGDHDYKRHFGGYVTHNLRVTVYRHAWLPRAENLARWARQQLRGAARPRLEPDRLPVQAEL